MAVSFTLNGGPVAVEDGISLLDALREELGCRSVKDGCSPQGQCGCCTVWVDGAPRVACVTPVRRIAGRHVTTLEGAPEALRDRWAGAFVQHGASQCGFCTPGIVLRLAALEEAANGKATDAPGRRGGAAGAPVPVHGLAVHRGGRVQCPGRRRRAAPGVRGCARPRAGRVAGPGRGPGLSDLRARRGPRRRRIRRRLRTADGALVQLGADGALATDLRAARAASGRVQGRNSTVPLSHPVALPDGRLGPHTPDIVARAGLCRARRQLGPAGPPPGLPAGQRRRVRREAAQPGPGAGPGARRRDRGGGPRAVAARGRRATWSQAPPLAIALRADGTGLVRIGRTERSADLEPLAAELRANNPGLEVELARVVGPPVSGRTCAARCGPSCWRRRAAPRWRPRRRGGPR